MRVSAEAGRALAITGRRDERGTYLVRSRRRVNRSDRRQQDFESGVVGGRTVGETHGRHGRSVILGVACAGPRSLIGFECSPAAAFSRRPRPYPNSRRGPVSRRSALICALVLSSFAVSLTREARAQGEAKTVG